MMKLAALQMQSAAGDVAANLDRITRAAAEAAAQGATLLLTPELGITGYGAGEALATLAEAPDGTIVQRLKAISSETGIALIAGFAERDGNDVYNSAVYVDGDAAPVVYRKSHLYGDYERSIFKAPGPETKLFVHRGVTCGMLICYDVEFPENVRRLALAGAEAVLVPTALPAGWSGSFIAEHMIQTRAFENQVFVAYINHHGSDPLFSFAGLSRIAAPDGQLLAKADAARETLLVADIDPQTYAISRLENTYLGDLYRR
ncbi:carbon-nitrogen hydrolase family protein [Ensifer adhaerens]|uniref:carbon-nitrogen hydrolase family protein n=1 Tax=Ensifer adhaerens TaxID=106592 RepID=UPI001CC1B555|nr:carbon-nitrogen hydrolase family protein [Ensifer adhaerens]MBZ7922925.1 carbon-nitrogen hydrolase family protein [Ensifer adhaerens]UAX91523.1 carbon-nitrogen hydrolase family protein [Ensifer adhaerens]UAX99151.1 carbon-nitrogen hydrolase family protein [Ensifer adhaerens]UAY06534.1 carbon-nitrogen hydrolase family protein [Ensifer adhaerens]